MKDLAWREDLFLAGAHEGVRPPLPMRATRRVRSCRRRPSPTHLPDVHQPIGNPEPRPSAATLSRQQAFDVEDLDPAEGRREVTLVLRHARDDATEETG